MRGGWNKTACRRCRRADRSFSILTLLRVMSDHRMLLTLLYFLVLLVHDCSDDITNGNHANYLLVENRDVPNVLVCRCRPGKRIFLAKSVSDQARIDYGMGYRAMLPLIMQTYLLAGTQEQVLTFFVWSKARNICIVTSLPFGTATCLVQVYFLR